MSLIDVANDADVQVRSATSGSSPRRFLCAYSPRWLSGPAPAYEGLCPTADALHSEARAGS